MGGVRRARIWSIGQNGHRSLRAARGAAGAACPGARGRRLPSALHSGGAGARWRLHRNLSTLADRPEGGSPLARLRQAGSCARASGAGLMSCTPSDESIHDFCAVCLDRGQWPAGAFDLLALPGQLARVGRRPIEPFHRAPARSQGPTGAPLRIGFPAASDGPAVGAVSGPRAVEARCGGARRWNRP